MSVAVVGTGRSGSNMVLEALRVSPQLCESEEIENKSLFKHPKKYPDNYLTKCDTFYIRALSNIDELFILNPDIKFVFTIRHPKSLVLSKIYRGQAGNDGNDTLADDASQEGCLYDLSHMMHCYRYFAKNHANILYVVKMTDMILDTHNTLLGLCNFLGIRFQDEMMLFYKHMRNDHKRQRYNWIDKSQVDIWKNWEGVYGGFFKNNPSYDVLALFKQVEYICDEFGFEK